MTWEERLPAAGWGWVRTSRTWSGASPRLVTFPPPRPHWLLLCSHVSLATATAEPLSSVSQFTSCGFPLGCAHRVPLMNVADRARGGVGGVF